MKKIIVLLLILSITGCVSNGKLTNTCKKVETASDLTNTTTYTINFESDEISNVIVTNDYTANSTTITSIKLSVVSQNNFWQDKINFNVLNDSNTNYKVEYIIDVNNTDEDIYNYFNLKKERSKLVSYLKDNGFTCE